MPRLNYYILTSGTNNYMRFSGNPDVYSSISDDLGIKLTLDRTVEHESKGSPARQNGVLYLSLILSNETRVRVMCSVTKLSTVFTSLIGKSLDVQNGAFDVIRVAVPKRLSYR